MVFLGLSKEDKQNLQYEIIPEDTRLKLTRLLRNCTSDPESDIGIIRQNKAINIARSVLGLSTYVLESDDWGNYHPAENAWHNGELDLIMRRPKTAQLVETLADLIQNGVLNEKDINAILNEGDVSVLFKVDRADDNVESLTVEIKPIEELEEDLSSSASAHPNIRALVARMETALRNNDYPLVLHTSASIFETLAKIFFQSPVLDEKSLGSFFDKYRKESGLLTPIIDSIQNIFNDRSIEPLAGHGSRFESKINRDQAVTLCEMTKAFIKIERTLANPQSPSIK